MKRIIAGILVVCMMLSMVGCSKEAEYKMGMGVVLNTDSSKENNAQVDATFAAVVVDEDGKIVKCELDCVQNKMDVTGGAVDVAATFRTKMEQGSDYGMVAYGNAIAEWDAQAQAFADFCEGKTVDEVKGIATTTNDHGYTVAADETLYASCTMQISEFIEAVAKACEDGKGTTFTGPKKAEEFTLGIAAVSTAAESTAATDTDDAVVKMYSEFAATAVDKDGKVLSAITDATQPQITVSKDGAITGSTYNGTKRELGADYGMVAYGAAIAEWDAQAQAFADFTVGKTASDIRAIETKTNDHGYAVPVDADLYASCTMQITGMMEVIARAVENAK